MKHTQTKDIQAKSSFYNELCITLVTLCGCLLIIIIICLLIGLLVWDGFAIKAMIETTNKDVKNICEKSNLWSYVGVLMLYNLSLFIYYLSSLKVHFTNNDIVCMLGCLYISVIVFSCWGSLEIFGNSCSSKLTNTLLYKLGYVILMLQYLLFSILPIVIIINLCRKTITSDTRDCSNNL
jgi:hypothetical protein|tara:strand:- start:1280 stop:1819 length:540 start_codon:yes stop_codon:yes gene_type:complete